jgi:hypothetical protein
MWARLTVADVPAELHHRLYRVSGYPRRSVGYGVIYYPLVLQSLVGGTARLAVSSDFLKTNLSR